MKRLIVAGLAGLAGACLYTTAALADNMIVAKSSVAAGDGQTITIKGNALPLAGHGIKVGDSLPSVVLTGAGLAPVNLTDSKGKIRIINVVPSLDTPVCDAQTHELSEKDQALASKIEMVTVSMDLPFAQQRWARDAKVKNVIFLSDYKTGDFGNASGLMIPPLRLLARAVIVTDGDNVVRYIQVVPELTELPDMGQAMDAAKGLL